MHKFFGATLKILLLFIVIYFIVGGIMYFMRLQKQTQTFITSPSTSMQISSLAFEANGQIPSKYSCDGENMSPPLQMSNIPANAKSLALIVHDPDAPRAGGWTHWILWNIPPQTQNINENQVPLGAVQGMTDFGKNAWGGPCPPSGTHHYEFRLYALDTTLEIPQSSTKADLEKAMQGHVLAQNTLVGLYKRSS